MADGDRFSDTETTLKILTAVENDSDKSQRALARDAEIALGLTNAYLKRCIRKGWIKVREAPARRYLYYITPKGFSEKTRLTAEYMANSFEMFRNTREQCDRLAKQCKERGFQRIALIGAGDLAEIAALSGLNSNIEIVAVVDPLSNQSQLAGFPVIRSLEEAGTVDAVMITDIRAPQEAYESLVGWFPDAQILIPPMLHVSRSSQRMRDDSEEPVE